MPVSNPIGAPSWVPQLQLDPQAPPLGLEVQTPPAAPAPKAIHDGKKTWLGLLASSLGLVLGQVAPIIPDEYGGPALAGTATALQVAGAIGIAAGTTHKLQKGE